MYPTSLKIFLSKVPFLIPKVTVSKCSGGQYFLFGEYLLLVHESNAFPYSKSQNMSGWKEPDTTPQLQAETPRDSGPGLCPEGFCTSLRGKAPQPPLTCMCQCSVILTVKRCFLLLRGNHLCSTCAHFLWPRAPLKRAWVCPLCPLISGIYRH